MHVPWPLLLSPLHALALWADATFPVSRVLLAGCAVAAGYLTGRACGGILATVGRYLPLAAGVAVAVYVMRG